MRPSDDGLICRSGEDRIVRLGETTVRIKAAIHGPEGFGLLEAEYDPDDQILRDHLHRSYDEAFYVLEGEFDFRLGDTLVRLGPGESACAPRGTPHTYKAHGGRARLLTLVTPGGALDFFDEMVAFTARAKHTAPPRSAAEIFAAHQTEFVPTLEPKEQ